jgi:membrane protein DedA with SNARE-associated domain
MVEKLMAAVSALIVSTISSLGYGGIVLMMAIESACIPLPSEVIMPFAGYLIATGRFGLQRVALAGALGCLLGSYAAYCAGSFGGRPFLRKYGRWFLIAPREIELADHFFDRWGSLTVFACRLLPVIRTFIAFPAGVARMNLTRFSIYTLVGSYLWCLALAYTGMKLGQHWSEIGPYFHRSQDVIAAFLAVAILVFLYNRIKTIRQAKETPDY